MTAKCWTRLLKFFKHYYLGEFSNSVSLLDTILKISVLSKKIETVICANFSILTADSETREKSRVRIPLPGHMLKAYIRSHPVRICII